MSNCANMPRICSKRAATSCPFFSPASVSTMKWSELIRSHCWSAADVGSVRLFLLYREGFEQKRFASHIHCHLGHFPIARNDLRAFYGELAALFEVSQQTSAKPDLVHQLAIDADQALLPGVDPDLACHFVKNLSFAGRRLETGIRSKDQFD